MKGLTANMAESCAQRLCIYCGRAVGGVKKGEHVVPEAIGGGVTIKTVCGECNNSFSQIDTELCSRSPLSIIASQEIDAHLWQIWDVDHSENELLLEARPDWAQKSLTLYPQIVFERSGPQIRGDYEEVNRFEQEQFQRVLVQCALRSFKRYKSGQRRWLHFERIDENHAAQRGYRLPPRIFSRHTIGELADSLTHNRRTSCILRYLCDRDRRFALNALDNWDASGRFRHFEVGVGSALPAMRCFHDACKTLRALAKIAVNLLAYCCPNTAVGPEQFAGVIRVIKGDVDVSSRLLLANGFVHADDIVSLNCPVGCHAFRILHMDNHWHVFSSFFGGRIGSFVRFPGPNQESWRCANIIAPIRSADWMVTTSQVLQPLQVRIEWADPSRIMPSVELFNVGTEVRVSRAARALRRRRLETH